MTSNHTEFAKELVDFILKQQPALKIYEGFETRVLASKPNGSQVSLDLTPFIGLPQKVTAFDFFNKVKNIEDLIEAYYTAKLSLPFELDVIDEPNSVDGYADQFLDDLFLEARAQFDHKDAQIIAEWVKNFDIYVAVKAVESLLNSKADLKVLAVAKKEGWNVHFDHLAIRCGSERRKDAQNVAKLLREHHGYTLSHVQGEEYYKFSDGWDAYPMYKILDNGQILRIFVDQSSTDSPEQIIQHWNHVYGFTSHHLAMSVTKTVNQQKLSIPLSDFINKINQNGIQTLTATGQYTGGLLQQVFTQPEKNTAVPLEIKERLYSISKKLPDIIANGKLLEMVSREEMPIHLATKFFDLYDLKFDSQHPLHSAPIYTYFLPAQAAHVIKTSQEISG